MRGKMVSVPSPLHLLLLPPSPWSLKRILGNQFLLPPSQQNWKKRRTESREGRNRDFFSVLLCMLQCLFVCFAVNAEGEGIRRGVRKWKTLVCDTPVTKQTEGFLSSKIYLSVSTFFVFLVPDWQPWRGGISHKPTIKKEGSFFCRALWALGRKCLHSSAKKPPCSYVTHKEEERDDGLLFHETM